jgi:hypothetical protein
MPAAHGEPAAAAGRCEHEAEATEVTPQMAYMNARLICRPEVEWLNEALG